MSELRDAVREAYDWLANQQKPPVEAPLSILLRYLPNVVTPVYVGAKLGVAVGTAGAKGTFGSGPTVGFVRTEEIAEYERTALGSSRVI